MSLAQALERAAEALPGQAEAIRPANGDARRVLEALDADAAARVLGWLLAHQPEEADELLEIWCEEPHGREPILALDESALGKAGRKALRRVRHRLRSQGVAVPGPAPSPGVASLPPLEDAFRTALVTAPDAIGVRMVYLVEPDPGGGSRLFEVTVDDVRGVLETSLYRTGRSKVRAFLREVAARPSLPAVTVAPDAARALIARVAGRMGSTRPPAGFEEWRSQLVVAPAGARTPGDEVVAALGEGGAEPPDPAKLAEAETRIRGGQIGPWPPPPDRLRELAERIAERARSPVLVTPAQRREQADAALAAALPDVYEPIAEATADRWREAAFVFWQRGDEEAARVALAGASAFATLPPAENPVARATLEASLGPLLASLDQDPEQEPEPDAESDSLIVKP